MTTEINLERKRGDTRRIIFRVKDSDGLPVDISSGYSFILTVDPERSPIDASNNLFQITGIIIDGPNGRVGFPLTDQQADNLGTYYYDGQMIDPNSEKGTIVDGKIKFSQDITKD
jgi:hypothetical protein